MADVFISYSRVDRDFVRRLHGALDSEDLEAWVDWQDIPVTVQWRSEIYAAIDGADTFVFVITPDSLASSVCQEELAHATAQSKRIVPIVWRRVDMDQMPHSLADINWLSMEQDAEFASAFSTLLEVLGTDLDHVRAHTRMLVRAREWERNASDPSFLLRGTDLRDAETWISRRGAAEPAPNDLQVSYILASRRHAQLRQRFLLAGVCVALLIAMNFFSSRFPRDFGIRHTQRMGLVIPKWKIKNWSAKILTRQDAHSPPLSGGNAPVVGVAISRGAGLAATIGSE